MKRISITIIALMILLSITLPAAAAQNHPFPEIIPLPDNFNPEGITTGYGHTFLVIFALARAKSWSKEKLVGYPLGWILTNVRVNCMWQEVSTVWLESMMGRLVSYWLNTI